MYPVYKNVKVVYKSLMCILTVNASCDYGLTCMGSALPYVLIQTQQRLFFLSVYKMQSREDRSI